MSNGVMFCLWFNSNAKEAVDFYMSVFKDSRIIDIDYYTEVGEEITGHKKGDIVTIEFEILSTKMLAINAGPEFQFNPSISLIVECSTQNEIDNYWNKLSSVPEAEQCGWLQDKYGLSWQIVPKQLNEMLKKGNPEQRKRVSETYMQMKKLIIKELEDSYKTN